MGSVLRPVDKKVLAALDPARARELAVYSAGHPGIFNVRLHSIRTCPYLAYMPAYAALRKDPARWAPWLHRFYRHKHKEEGHCRCDALLGK